MNALDHQEKEKPSEQPSHALFLCFFDERRGHVMLYAYPHDLLDDKMERKIISIHSIWWLKPEEHESGTIEGFDTDFKVPEHVDLELAGRIYAAIDFRMKTARKKRRSGMTGKLADEKFVLIARSPSVLSFISDEILDLAYDRIRSEIGNKLNYLVLQNLSSMGEGLPVGFIREEVEYESRETIKQLDEICMNLVPIKSASTLGREAESRELSFKEQMSISILNERLSSKPPVQPQQRVRKFTIASDRKVKTSNRKPEITTEIMKSFKFTGHSISHQDEKIAFNVINNSKTAIRNPTVKVTETRGFFDLNTWDISLPRWKAGEELVFKVPISDLTQKEGNYIIMVTEAGEQLWIKKIAFADLQS